MEPTITENAAEQRFEIHSDGHLAGFTQYRRRGEIYEFFHTEIDDAFEGRGLGSKLIVATLDTMRERGIKVIPSCPFVRRYIEEHPAYADLVA